jgi:hypothetical protein
MKMLKKWKYLKNKNIWKMRMIQNKEYLEIKNAKL